MTERFTRVVLAAALCLCMPRLVAAQQRPLVTEDPETVGAGRILVEGGVDLLRDVSFPISGLDGNLVHLPSLGVSIGVGAIAEIQVDGVLYRRLTITERNPAPLSNLVDVTGDTTTASDDLVVATKIRLTAESARRPAFGLRLATKLPNASNESGLGLDTTDFFASMLVAKTTRSVRVVGNGGLAIIADPTNGNRQDDLLTLGLSVARAVTANAEVVSEFNGRFNFARGESRLSAQSRGVVRVGARYTRGLVRLDAAALIGVTATDPDIGLTAGLTWVFNAFRVP